MGRGDIRTKKGKIRSGSFGNSRPKKSTIKASVAVKAAKDVSSDKK